MALNGTALLNVLMHSQKETCKIYEETVRLRVIH